HSRRSRRVLRRPCSRSRSEPMHAPMTAINHLSLVEMAEAIAKGEVTALAATQAALAAFVQHDQQTNAALKPEHEEALAAAGAPAKGGAPRRRGRPPKGNGPAARKAPPRRAAHQGGPPAPPKGPRHRPPGSPRFEPPRPAQTGGIPPRPRRAKTATSAIA